LFIKYFIYLGNFFIISKKIYNLKYIGYILSLLDLNKEQFITKIIPKISSSMNLDTQLLKCTSYTLSSVLIIIHFTNIKPSIILTKRSSLLKNHKNEISFPGGTFKEADGSLINTAIRETKEEIGLDFSTNEINGCFQLVKTLTSRYIIVPFITFQDRIKQTNLLRDEVSNILDIPVFDLFENLDNNFNYRNFTSSYLFRYNNEIIWGATARILKQIRDCFY
jgi:8-oxo-dGTP pyrophosphatase MutT (NUDIX family)